MLLESLALDQQSRITVYSACICSPVTLPLPLEPLPDECHILQDTVSAMAVSASLIYFA